MIKTFIAFVALVASTTSFASGKITLSPSYHYNEQTWVPNVGLSIHHPLVLNKLFVTSWTGMGQDSKLEADGSAKYWLATTNGVELMFGSYVVLGGTITLARDTNANSWDNKLNVKLAIQLW